MIPRLPPTPFLRRDILGGLGSIAMASMLRAEESWLPPDGLPMIPQRAKRVIWLFMRGGVSHMESFDPKPMLTKYAGKSIGETPYKEVQNPEKLKKVRVVVVNDANGQQRNVIYPLQTGYKRYGQCGVEISDWFPNIGSCADEIAFIRSMWTTSACCANRSRSCAACGRRMTTTGRRCSFTVADTCWSRGCRHLAPG